MQLCSYKCSVICRLSAVLMGRNKSCSRLCKPNSGKIKPKHASWCSFKHACTRARWRPTQNYEDCIRQVLLFPLNRRGDAVSEHQQLNKVINQSIQKKNLWSQWLKDDITKSFKSNQSSALASVAQLVGAQSCDWKVAGYDPWSSI